ncbi:MAG: DUF2778 domain-containing protein [Aquisalimonadaceae bacterium]
MKKWTFKLNDEPMSAFVGGASAFPAFSGLGDHVNRRLAACLPSKGPIPPGTYYIFDRESGGRLSWWRDLFSGRSNWFALYADDGKVDDNTWCEQVKRGQFRLHPKGRSGISQGCIVIDNPRDYQFLGAILRNSQQAVVEGIGLKAWGKVSVK